ncbi:cytochrome P450 [Pseudonocardia lutea]|uniref:Cytochrome P450 n=1 Tax=Pseudonocardia lutea TaxID=2172015 RepID=A0ABW1I919_9PSEU
MESIEATQNRAAESADHIPDHPEAIARYAEQRRSCPVARVERHGGYWQLTRYTDVHNAARDYGTYRSGQPFPEFPGFALSIPIASNPPDHTVYRKLLNPYFTAARVEALRPQIESFVNEHVTNLIEGGRGEAAAELARPLPQRVLAALMNMPDETWRTFVDKLHQLESVAHDPEAAAALVATLWTDDVIALVESRRAHPMDPEHDLMSGVLAARDESGEPFPPEIPIAIGVQLFAAGGDTTTQAITAALHEIAMNPKDQIRLRATPALIPDAVEEYLRFHPPLHQLARTLGSDVELHGQTMSEGELVALNWASANRDSEKFPEPDRCLIDRSPNRHLTFGNGPHQCIGAPFARLEIQATLSQLLQRTAWIEPDGEPVRTHGEPLHSGFSRLPLRFPDRAPR